MAGTGAERRRLRGKQPPAPPPRSSAPQVHAFAVGMETLAADGLAPLLVFGTGPPREPSRGLSVWIVSGTIATAEVVRGSAWGHLVGCLRDHTPHRGRLTPGWV